MPLTYYVRTDGGNTTQSTGLADAAYPGSGTGTASAFNNPQYALNAAACGDTIQIRAGDSFSGNFIMPNHGVCGSFITVKTSGAIPSAGTRITPAYAAQMAKLVSPTSTPVLTPAVGANHYKFVGIEFTGVGGSVVTDQLVVLDQGDHFTFDRCWIHEATNDTTTPDSIVTTSIIGIVTSIDSLVVTECRIAGFRGYRPISQGIEASIAILFAGSASNSTVYNSYLSGWFVSVFFASGQGSTNTATISNVHWDAVTHIGDAVFSNITNLVVGDLVALKTTGGHTPPTNPPHPNESVVYQVVKVTSLPDIGTHVDFISWGSPDGNVVSGNPLLQVPDVPGEALWRGYTNHDIILQRNQFVVAFNAAETIWVNSGGSPTTLPRETQTTYGNSPKGHIEIKSGTNILIDGNTFEGWHSGYTLTSRNQGSTLTSGGNPWSGLFNVTISNNWHKKSINFDRLYAIPYGGPQLEDNEFSNTRSGPLTITNNLIDSGVENILSSMSGADNVTVTHNTYPGLTRPSGGSMVVGQGVDNPGFIFRDNIVSHGEYGLNCQTGGINAWPGVTTSCGSGVILGSQFKKNVITDNRTADSIIGNGPLNSRYPNDFINTDQTHNTVRWINPLDVDYRLASDSPYRNAASDGTNIGVNWTTLVTALGFDPKTSPASTISGIKNILFIRARHTDHPSDALPSDGNLNSWASATDADFRTASYGVFSLTWDVGPVITLPHSVAFYVTDPRGRTTGTLADAQAAAVAAGYTLANYDIIEVWIPSFYGVYSSYIATLGSHVFLVNADTLGQTYGVEGLIDSFFIPFPERPNGWVSNDLTVFGSAGFPDPSGIANPYDTFGTENVGHNYNLYHKRQANWIPDSYISTIGTNGTYRIYAHDTETRLTTGRLYGIRMPGHMGTDYWIEFRDGGLYGISGLLIDWGGLLLLDMTPTAGAGSFTNAPLTVGSTFTDPEGRSIFVSAVGGTSPRYVDVVIGGLAGDFPPVVNAGNDQSLGSGTTSTTLTATAVDPDGGPVTVVWSRTSGPNTPTITSPTALSTTVTGMVAGTYIFRCTGTDNEASTAFDEVQVVIAAAANQPPVVNAGPTQNLSFGTTATTTAATASDPDGDPLTYQWQLITNQKSTVIATPTALNTNISNMISSGPYVFRLAVTDIIGGATVTSDLTVNLATGPVNAISTSGKAAISGKIAIK